MTRQKQTLTVLFLDVKGYSGLKTDHQFGIFFDQVLPKMAGKLNPCQPFYVNSWGDAIVAAFADPLEAARAALDLRDLFRNTNWQAIGLPNDLAARICLHSGAIFTGRDPIQRRNGLAGHNVNLAARIEPVVTPNEVWMTDSVATLLQNPPNNKICWDDLGDRPLAKMWGSCKLYRLRRYHEPPNLQISDLEPAVPYTHPGHWLLSNLSLWEGFTTILSFAKETHTVFQTLDMSHIKPLSESVGKFIAGSIPKASWMTQKMECERWWTNYMKQYDCTAFFHNLPANQTRVAGAFNVLQTNASHSTGKVIDKCKNYYESINKFLPGYLTAHNAAVSSLGPKRLFDVLDDPLRSQEFWIQLNELSSKTAGSITQADTLIVNLINLIA